MSPRAGAGVRVAIVGIFAVLVTVFIVSEARTQPRPPGIPRPPGMPSPPKFPTPPTFNPPTFPTPPTFNPPTMPNIPTGPQFERVWTCSGCKAELGRGNIKPGYDSCPKCGVRFINGGGGGLVNPVMPNLGGGTPTMPQPAMPGTTTPPVTTDPDLLPRGTPSTTSPAPEPANSTPSASASSTSSSDKPVSKTGSVVLKIMIGVFALLFLLGLVGGAFLIMQANKGSKPSRKSRRRMDDDDDDH